jgi:hypothetical protein
MMLNYKDKIIPVSNIEPIMKPYGRVEVQIHALLILALDRGEWLVSRSGDFAPEDKKIPYPLDSRRGGLCG